MGRLYSVRSIAGGYNPVRGWIVTANQDPFPENYPYRVSGDFGAPYRSNEIRERLIARTGWKPEDMLTVQKDVYSSFSSFWRAGSWPPTIARSRPSRKLHDAVHVAAIAGTGKWRRERPRPC